MAAPVVAGDRERQAGSKLVRSPAKAARRRFQSESLALFEQLTTGHVLRMPEHALHCSLLTPVCSGPVRSNSAAR